MKKAQKSLKILNNQVFNRLVFISSYFNYSPMHDKLYFISIIFADF